MNVVSTFDGISCGQLALQRAGIPVEKYFASEVDVHAIRVTMKHFPNTIQLGDVTKVKGSDLPKIDMIIGGSPCQGFSRAGKRLNFKDPRSMLFFEFVRLYEELKLINPDIKFFLENVWMKQEHQDVISKFLGVNPVLFNSALVSAQNRDRLYWTNIGMRPSGLFGYPESIINPPADKGLFLKDIAEPDAIPVTLTERRTDESKAIRKEHLKRGKDWNPRHMTKLVPREDGKANCITANQSVNHLIGMIKNEGVWIEKNDKSQCLDANYFKGPDNHGQRTIMGRCIQIGEADINGHDSIKRVYSIEGKSPCVTSVTGGGQEPKISLDLISWRKLTPLECERLQTLPDNYTDILSNTQRYKSIGNGWTVDMIVHFFTYL